MNLNYYHAYQILKPSHKTIEFLLNFSKNIQVIKANNQFFLVSLN